MRSVIWERRHLLLDNCGCPEIDWRTGEVRMTWCPHECNVSIRSAKKEKKKKKIAEGWKYCPTIEEVEDEEFLFTGR